MAAFEDTFTDSVGTKLENHTPDVGTSWALISGTTTVYEIRSDSPNGNELDAINSANDGYHCDDQGSVDHLTVLRMADISQDLPMRNMFACVRLTDNSNGIGWRWYGTGGLGSRVTKIDGGSYTDLIQQDGAESNIRHGWVKVEAEGDTIELFHGGTGSSPSWVAQASATEAFNNTETRQGVVKNGGSLLGQEWITDFQADPIGGGGGGQTVTVNQASETETSQAVGKAKVASVGLAAEVSTSQSVTPTLAAEQLVGQATSTETAQTVATVKSLTLGQVVETSASQDVSPTKGNRVGQVVETSSAFSLGKAKTRSVSQATETQDALPIGNAKVAVLGMATETSAARGVSASVATSIVISQPYTREYALDVKPVLQFGYTWDEDTQAWDLDDTQWNQQIVSAGQVVETETAFAATAIRTLTLGLTGEASAALSATPRRTYDLAQLLETDAAQGISARLIPGFTEAGKASTIWTEASKDDTTWVEDSDVSTSWSESL